MNSAAINQTLRNASLLTEIHHLSETIHLGLINIDRLRQVGRERWRTSNIETNHDILETIEELEGFYASMHAKVEELILQSSGTCEEYNTEISPTYHTSLRASVTDWERVIRGLKTTVLAILVNE
jgi:hypothetical protein